MIAVSTLLATLAPTALAAEPGAAPQLSQTAPPALTLQTQPTWARRTVYLERGGLAPMGPTTTFALGLTPHLELRAGLSFGVGLSLGFDGDTDLLGSTALLVGGSALFFPGAHHLELGWNTRVAGLTWQNTDVDWIRFAAVAPVLGYRYQKLEGGLVVRAGVQPQFWIDLEHLDSRGVALEPGVSVGWAF